MEGRVAPTRQQKSKLRVARVSVGRFIVPAIRSRDGGTALRDGKDFKPFRRMQKDYEEIMSGRKK